MRAQARHSIGDTRSVCGQKSRPCQPDNQDMGAKTPPDPADQAVIVQYNHKRTT